jgi:hypothetical protein
VLEHWAVLADLEFATVPKKQVKAAVLELTEVTFFVFVTAVRLIYATVPDLHWHSHPAI